MKHYIYIIAALMLTAATFDSNTAPMGTETLYKPVFFQASASSAFFK